ncbi:MAG: hypothetical protein VKL42_11905 [Snowella sp.]|nr:hypothetical protein [Snowella sp.]
MNLNLTVPITPNLNQRLKEAAKTQNKSEQALILEALENHLDTISPPQNCYDLLEELGILETIKEVDLPPDLSTNPKYLKNFGDRFSPLKKGGWGG